MFYLAGGNEHFNRLNRKSVVSVPGVLAEIFLKESGVLMFFA